MCVWDVQVCEVLHVNVWSVWVFSFLYHDVWGVHMCKIFLKGGGWRVQVLQVCVRDVQMCIRCSSKMHKVLRYSVFIMVCEVFMSVRCSCMRGVHVCVQVISWMIRSSSWGSQVYSMLRYVIWYAPRGNSWVCVVFKLLMCSSVSTSCLSVYAWTVEVYARAV